MRWGQRPSWFVATNAGGQSSYPLLGGYGSALWSRLDTRWCAKASRKDAVISNKVRCEDRGFFSLSHSLGGYSVPQQSTCTIRTAWYPIFLPGCSLLGSFPLPPLTRGPCLAPAGMSSCTHTWSSAHWGPCWTACTCTPNLRWTCMNTHRHTY